jgi:hypothetical protein
MRLDIWLWLAGSILLMIAGLFRLLWRTDEYPHQTLENSPLPMAGWRLWAPLVLTCLGLACLAAGLAWRITVGGILSWPSGGWPGMTPADGIVLLAGGTLAILLGILFCDTRRVKVAKSRLPGEGRGGLDRDRAVVEALTLFGACLLVFVGIGAIWSSQLPEPSPLARSWLFGLRVIAASLGLGAWLPAFADAAWGLRPGRRDSGPGVMRATLGLEAMRLGYPWLTMACLLSAALSLAASAALWRGRSPDAWLVTAWLLGAIYLVASGDARPFHMPRWALVLLTACGAAVAVLQAWQMPLLLS